MKDGMVHPNGKTITKTLSADNGRLAICFMYPSPEPCRVNLVKREIISTINDFGPRKNFVTTGLRSFSHT